MLVPEFLAELMVESGELIRRIRDEARRQSQLLGISHQRAHQLVAG